MELHKIVFIIDHIFIELNLHIMAAHFYSKSLRKKYKYFGNWEPGTPIALGDIGELDGYTFNRIGNISDEGIEFEEIVDEQAGDLQFQSDRGINVTQKVAGKVDPKLADWLEAEAGFVLEFNKDDSVLFQAKKTLNHSIKNIIDLGREIEERYNSSNGKSWKKSWVIITQIITARKGIVIVSEGKGGKLELKAKGGVGIQDFDLVDLSSKFAVNRTQFDGFIFEASKGFSPLFKLHGIKMGWFAKKGEFTSRSPLNTEEREGFTEIVPEELVEDV